MTRAIFKYAFWAPTQTIFPGYVLKAEGERSQVELPHGAIIRHVGEQNGQLCLWAEVDPFRNTTEVRIFEVYGTGDHITWNMGTEREFIGTVQMECGLVYHIYEYTGV